MGVQYLNASATTAGAPIAVCYFDVFGTVVDWRSSVESQLYHYFVKCKRIAPTQVSASDLTARFADAWRQGYYAYTKSIAALAPPVRKEDGYARIDDVHRRILSDLMKDPQFGLAELVDEAAEHADRALLDDLNLAWHRLSPWRDSIAGIRAIKSNTVNRCQTATLSNGNTALLANMARFAQLDWDLILSSELWQSAKGNKVVYDGALQLLSIDKTPEAGLMVAAHLNDLRAAKGRGMRTCYIRRDGEQPVEDADMATFVDFVVDTLGDIVEVVNATWKGREPKVSRIAQAVTPDPATAKL